MTGFSASWLALREAADHRARNRALGDQVSAYFSEREELHITDLGAGTGSNLRASYGLLAKTQYWTLIDHDARLLDHARQALLAWADEGHDDGQLLHLGKGRTRMVVALKAADLVDGLQSLIPERCDLLTASALFDLVSAKFMKRLVKVAQSRRAVVYAVLTYNGQMAWTPHQPLDNAMRGAFHAHQIRDKGFGPAAGPTAANELADALAMAGYSTREASSDWVLASGDQALIAMLSDGYAAAAEESGELGADEIGKWRTVARTRAVVGHTDLLAFPPADGGEDDGGGDFDDDNDGNSDGL